MKKIFTIGNVREVMDAYERGEISYSKMVETFNQMAAKPIEPIEPDPSTGIEIDEDFGLGRLDSFFTTCLVILLSLMVIMCVYHAFLIIAE